MTKKIKRPEWVPKNAGKEFTTNVMKGVKTTHDGMHSGSINRAATSKGRIKRPRLTADDYVNGVLEDDRTILARTITLIESNASAHMEQAQEVLRELMPQTGKSIRVGITGVPGAGKSTFIEELGQYLIKQGHKVAVLAIDPSSSLTRGSILGDKTRMEKLSQNPNSFIRPSPSGGTLGGVARKTRETMLVCEAAGFDVILVETVGVGQNEITVRSMVDFFLLVQISGAGDELQGIKKGVIEIADAILVNKADGDNKPKAEAAKQQYSMALHYLSKATEGWDTRAFTCSALTGEGIPEIWKVVQKFHKLTTTSNVFANRRRLQAKEWMHSMVQEHLKEEFYNNPQVQEIL
ncbi:MAG: methylmalonyl Co-A mutase-associated GTPase MeaB, partial [Calditrichia bacterium]|nr:methylmalonyl Co-A mutase-associated GTPase MeaB [Calditrichia bacterium]